MRVGRTNIRQVLNDTEIVLVAFQRGEALGQFIQEACLRGVKRFLREAIPHSAKNQPCWRLGECRGRLCRTSNGFQKWQRQHRAARQQEGPSRSLMNFHRLFITLGTHFV